MPAAGTGAPGQQEPGRTGTEMQPAGARPISVWLIEDHHTFRQTVVRVLQQADGIECTRQFSNCEAALEELGKSPAPDVVLLDVELPGMNGIDAVAQIRGRSPDTRIIMLTVFDDHEKIFRAICAGASGYLLKTSSIEKIIESVREAQTGGAPMTPRIARKVLDMFSRLRPPQQQSYGLTARETQVLECMAAGLIKKEIADRLTLSYHTVDTHLRNIYAKLHVNTRTAAVAKALKEGLF